MLICLGAEDAWRAPYGYYIFSWIVTVNICSPGKYIVELSRIKRMLGGGVSHLSFLNSNMYFAGIIHLLKECGKSAFSLRGTNKCREDIYVLQSTFSTSDPKNGTLLLSTERSSNF